MNKRGILIFSVALLAFCICACANTPVENKIDNTKQVDINDEQQKAEKEKEKLKIEPLSEEQEKQQRKEKLAELTAQLEAAEYEFNILNSSDEPIGILVGDKIVEFEKEEKDEKDEMQEKEKRIKSMGYYRIMDDISRQINSLLDLQYDEKYILDFENKQDMQINGNRALNAAELAFYYPEIKVPWQIGDYHFVQAMIGFPVREIVENKDEPRSTIIKRDISISNPYTVQLLYVKGEKSININIINEKEVFELSKFIDKLKPKYVNENLTYRDYMTEPWKPNYKEYKLYKYYKNTNDNCYDGFGTFNADNTYYIAVEVGNSLVHHALKRIVTIPSDDNTYDNMVKLMDELDISKETDNIITGLGLK